MEKWKCYKCGKLYNIRANVGLCNSITNKDLCIYCYNKEKPKGKLK